MSLPVGEGVWKLDHFCDSFWISPSSTTYVLFLVTFLLHLSDHSLECGAPPNGKENLWCDAICNALQALLDKGFPLQIKLHVSVQTYNTSNTNMHLYSGWCILAGHISHCNVLVNLHILSLRGNTDPYSDFKHCCVSWWIPIWEKLLYPSRNAPVAEGPLCKKWINKSTESTRIQGCLHTVILAIILKFGSIQWQDSPLDWLSQPHLYSL